MMIKIKRREALQVTLVLGLVAGFGCSEYTVETTLNADGSGSRSEMVVAKSAGDSVTTPEEYVYLMNVSRKDGWTYTLDLDGEDSAHVFRRERRVGALAGWPQLGGSLHISGATTATAEQTIGHVTLGDVHFLNAVSVEAGRAATAQVIIYRESFYWENMPDALFEFVAGAFEVAVASEFPRLNARERGELVGLVRGGLWAAVDEGLLGSDEEKEERALSTFTKRTATQAAVVVGRRHRAVDERYFIDLLEELSDESDGPLGEFISGSLPGAELAFNSGIEFRLNMPGKVTATNAHSRDGDTLVWEFSPADALAGPVEVFAESVPGE